jgi:hypothetical protein
MFAIFDRPKNAYKVGLAFGMRVLIVNLLSCLVERLRRWWSVKRFSQG